MTEIPVTVIVVTKDEEAQIARCLGALQAFDEVIVVDSGSADATAQIAASLGAKVVSFSWNGLYPKKRQWCLDTLSLKNERVFFVDADEEVTPELAREIAMLDWTCAAYFVTGLYVINGRIMHHGFKNKKLCLFDRRMVRFPIVDDLGIGGMGEIEGHYQPVVAEGEKIGRIGAPLLHHAMSDADRHAARHARYAVWEGGMRRHCAYPQEQTYLRHVLKETFHRMPFRACAAFAHSYVLRFGFLAGREGWMLARSRFDYYTAVRREEKRRSVV